MRPWPERTREEAHLLNPPFCCATLTSACVGFAGLGGRSLPFALAFMVLPIALHRHTRESLPRTTRTSVPAWLEAHAEARIRFHERLMALQPHTREALSYGLAFGWMAIGDSGLTPQIGSGQMDRVIRSLDGDARQCVSRARFVGKWFGTSSSTETLMALWGIRP